MDKRRAALLEARIADYENAIRLQRASEKPCFGTIRLAPAIEPCRSCSHLALCREQGQQMQIEGLEAAIDTYLHVQNEAAAMDTIPAFVLNETITPRQPRSYRPPSDEIVDDDANWVDAAIVEAQGEFQKRAKMVPWPKTFCMETGRDRRPDGNLENRDRRHQIDWYRPGSYVEPMPNIERLIGSNNPYFGSTGKCAELAAVTWTVFVKKRICGYEDIVDEVIKIGSFKNTPYNRTAVRDTLRDCALFGLVKRKRRGTRILFEIPI